MQPSRVFWQTNYLGRNSSEPVSYKAYTLCADEKLRLATLRAPSDGTILEVFVDAGDAVAQAPLLRLAGATVLVISAPGARVLVPAVPAAQAAALACALAEDAP